MRILTQPHPCLFCGRETTNHRCCSRQCNGKLHVQQWNGQKASEETKVKMSRAHSGKSKPWVRQTALRNIQKWRETWPERVKTICIHCGKEFAHQPKEPRVYCSRECMRTREFHATFECRYCGKPFRALINSSRRYCSAKCTHASKRGVPATRLTNGAASAGIVGIRPDLRQFFRSRWEANYARVLELQHTPYTYEPKRFLLPMADGRLVGYTPDFEIPSGYVEIKGWWRDGDAEKVKQFRYQYPLLPISVVGAIEYKAIEARFAQIIPGWEYDGDQRPMLPPINCQVCGQPIKRPRRHSHYCSATCAGKSRALPRITRICKRCGDTFEVIESTRNKRMIGKQYCSHRCATRDNILIALAVRWADKRPATKA